MGHGWSSSGAVPNYQRVPDMCQVARRVKLRASFFLETPTNDLVTICDLECKAMLCKIELSQDLTGWQLFGCHVWATMAFMGIPSESLVEGSYGGTWLNIHHLWMIFWYASILVGGFPSHVCFQGFNEGYSSTDSWNRRVMNFWHVTLYGKRDFSVSHSKITMRKSWVNHG